MNYQEQYDAYFECAEKAINTYANAIQTRPKILGESMKYSLQNGGKRVRPVLFLSAADLLGIEKEKVLPFAVALEMIHTYSLIHDDLPAMDNDDFRRGKPSSHKKFGEGNAVLAGDALLNTAYELLFEQALLGEKEAKAAKLICEYAGISGMIAGQSADLYFTSKNEEIKKEDLLYIYTQKTAKLLTAPFLATSILAGGKGYDALSEFGTSLGMIFQITDDLLDMFGSFEKVGKSIGKDKKEDKLTSIKLFGVDGARKQAETYAKSAISLLRSVGNSAFLEEFIEKLLHREK